jgi:hypothetical protein
MRISEGYVKVHESRYSSLINCKTTGIGFTTNTESDQGQVLMRGQIYTLGLNNQDIVPIFLPNI